MRKTFLNKLMIIFCSLVLFLGVGIKVHAQTVTSNQTVTKVGNAPDDQRPGGRVGFVYYCQGNTQWRDSQVTPGCLTYGKGGCGPTSLAMVMSSFGNVASPVDVGTQIAAHGLFVCGDGTAMEQLLSNSSAAGFRSQLRIEVGQNLITNGGRGHILDLALAQQQLGPPNNQLIIASSNEFPCANCNPVGLRVDHIFVVDGVDPQAGTVSIRDPNNCSYGDGNDENPSKIIHNVNEFNWLYAYPVKGI